MEQPKQLETADLQKLREICQDYINFIDNDEEYWKFISEKLELIELKSWKEAKDKMEYFINNPEEAENYRVSLITNWNKWKNE